MNHISHFIISCFQMYFMQQINEGSLDFFIIAFFSPCAVSIFLVIFALS